MTANGLGQIALYLGVVLALVKPLGWYMARVYEHQPVGLDRVLGPVEMWLYRCAGVRASKGMTWQVYAFALLLFNGLGLLLLYTLLRLQRELPLNSQGVGAVAPALALNAAVSFTSNTNWQAYSGEAALSNLSQMLGMTVQNFLSAATGMAVLVALVRGLRQSAVETVGNFWVDMTRTVLYILLPLSLIWSILMVSQGVVQTLGPARSVPVLDIIVSVEGAGAAQQLLPTGPVASQVAIKQLGTNGGGFFNANSAHPFENPTPLSNFLEMLAILLIPAALTYTFGRMMGEPRQGWALLAAMMLIFVILLASAVTAEQAGNPQLNALGIDQNTSLLQAGGNMEGKEVRFGIANSALWATATTAASNGSVNSMHDSFTPLGGLVTLFLMQLGEVIFGGVGSGLYGMLVFAIVAVFVAGLMVGRTPEYLGKKIEAREIKMASLIILIPPFVVLSCTALGVMTNAGLNSLQEWGPHGLSEVLYAFSSMGNNNGSAFAGLNANAPFYNLLGSVAMLVARYWLVIPTLALAGSLARKRRVPAGAGTLPTHTPLFVGLLDGIILIVGGLTFLPALALGPIVEHIMLWRIS